MLWVICGWHGGMSRRRSCHQTEIGVLNTEAVAHEAHDLVTSHESQQSDAGVAHIAVPCLDSIPVNQ